MQLNPSLSLSLRLGPLTLPMAFLCASFIPQPLWVPRALWVPQTLCLLQALWVPQALCLLQALCPPADLCSPYLVGKEDVGNILSVECRPVIHLLCPPFEQEYQTIYRPGKPKTPCNDRYADSCFGKA